MYDDHHFTHDAATVQFDDDAPGITVDENGDASFNWDDVETVTVDNPPHAEAFDTKRFYRIPATVARPIPQPYQYGEDTVWLKKPRDALKKAAWSLDNAPWTMGHPDTGMVKDVDDIRGFWNETHYIDSLDSLDSHLHIPVEDEDSKEYLEENTDVSVGFYNRITRQDEYDGIVGGADADDIEVEGYQTDMLFDHCASVQIGRCPSDAGCGIDAHQHGHMMSTDEAGPFIRGTRTTDISDDTDGTASDMQHTTDQPSGIKTADGTWFAVGPNEHTKDSTDHPDDHMYRIDTCSDVADAWNLRTHGEDLSISQDTLEERIIRAAEAKGCDGLPSTLSERMDSPSDNTDCGCGNTHDTDMDIEFDDLSAEAALAKVSEQHDGVSDRLEELREAEDLAETAQETADELDLDDPSDLPDNVGLLQERVDELQEQVGELQRPQMEEDAEYIAEHTDRFGEDTDEVIEALDEDPDEIADKRELVEELTSEFDEQTANPGNDDPEPQTDGKYVKTPWE